MKSLFIAVAVGALFLIGCSRSGSIPADKTVDHAPTEVSHTGYLVLYAKESGIAQLARANADVYVRIINSRHGLYEIHGASWREVVNAAGESALIQANHYMNYDDSHTSSLNNEFLYECRNNIETSADHFEVVASHPLDKYKISHIYNLGDSVHVRFQANEPKKYLYKLTPPDGSQLDEIMQEASEFSFVPDINGEYALTVVSKDKNLHCFLQRKSIYVTANPKLDSSHRLSTAEKDSFELTDFWHLEELQANKAWEFSTGKNTLIAIIDTGVNYNHESLNENIYINSAEIPANGIDDDNNGFVDDVHGYDFASSDPHPYDDNGHGTHVAGLAAASSFGIAKDAQILPIKTLTGIGMDLGSFVGAVFYAVDQKADIINASFGWPEDHPVFKEAISYANKHDVLVVAAAGNGGARNIGLNNDTTPSYPTNYEFENILAVAASRPDGVLTNYSNYGKYSVDIATLGGAGQYHLLSADAHFANNKYAHNAGTSMATPIVAGAAALALSQDPSLTAAELKKLLFNSAEKHEHLRSKLSSSGLLRLPGPLSGLP